MSANTIPSTLSVFQMSRSSQQDGEALDHLVPSSLPVLPQVLDHLVVPFSENEGINPLQTNGDGELTFDTLNQRDASTISLHQNTSSSDRFRSQSAPPSESAFLQASHGGPVSVGQFQNDDEDRNVESVPQASARQENSTVYGRKKNWIAVGALVMVAVLWVFTILLAQGFFGPRLPYDIAAYMAAGALVLSLVPLTLFMARWYDDRPNATFVRA